MIAEMKALQDNGTMKNKTSQLTKPGILLMGILLFFTNCQKQEYLEPIENHQSKYLVTKVKANEINNNSSLIEKLSELEQNKGAIKGYAARYDNVQFNLNLNEAAYIESADGSYHSYTFSIYNEDDSYDINNIVLVSYNGGDYEAYLSTYTLTQEERGQLEDGINLDLGQKASFETFDINQINTYNRIGGGGGCFDLVLTEVVSDCPAGHNAFACTTDCCGGCFGYVYEWQEEACPAGGGGGSGDAPGNPTGPGNPIGPGTGGGGSGSGDGSTIPTTPMYPDGTSAAPDFLINALGGESQLTTTQLNWINNPNNDALVNQLLNAFPSSNSNAIIMALTALMNNSNIHWSLIEDWFLNTPGYTETNLNLDPNNITYDTPLTQQNLPSIDDFVYNFPKFGTAGNYYEMPTPSVYTLVGGSLLNSHINNPTAYSNACSIRGSRGLLYSGIQIPVLNYPGVGQRTQKGSDNKNYILDAVSFDKFMRDKFGAATYELTGVDANDPVQVANLLNGKNGIYVIINNSHAQAGYSGHVDAIINGNCISSAYTTPQGGVKSIRIWELN